MVCDDFAVIDEDKDDKINVPEMQVRDTSEQNILADL